MFPIAATQIRAMPVPTAAEAATLTACLSPSERRLMTNYRHERRRSEFVGGRLALKRALLETQDSAVRIGTPAPLSDAFLPAAQRMQILPDRAGRPELWVENAVVPTQLSITHAAGWVAAACSYRPIGVDIVDINAPTGVPDDLPWFASVAPGSRARLRTLIWGLHECLLKADGISERTVWSLNGVQTVPACPAHKILARWPQPSGLAHLEIEVENRLLDGAFMSLSRSALMVVILLPDRGRLEVHK